jgi:hypothetical protein
MNDLFIQIRDGQPYQHPILGANFRAAFPDVDTENLPPEFAPFERRDPSEIRVGVFQVLVESYVWDGPIVRDNWTVRDMTDDERAAKIAEHQSYDPPFPNWKFNVDTLRWEAPIPMPATGGPYRWDIKSNSWESYTPSTPPSNLPPPLLPAK